MWTEKQEYHLYTLLSVCKQELCSINPLHVKMSESIMSDNGVYYITQLLCISSNWFGLCQCKLLLLERADKSLKTTDLHVLVLISVILR